MSTVDWRNLPTVIISPSRSPASTEPTHSDAFEQSNDEQKTEPQLDLLTQENSPNIVITETEVEDDDRDDSEEEREARRREKRRAKHIAKIQEKYADYLSDGGSSVSSRLTSVTESLQTVPYRAPRRTLGCPHWRNGCKFEGDADALSNHIENDCVFEKMKGMIKKRDLQIRDLQNSCKLLSNQNYMLSHLPNHSGSEPDPPLSLDRNLSSELYDVTPSNAINLSLHTLDDTTRPLAYQRRSLSRDAISQHEMAISGSMALIWRSMETLIGYRDQNEESVLNPSVHYANGHSTQKSLTSPNTAFTFNGHPTATNGRYQNGKPQHAQDVAVRSLIMFWNKVISTSAMGIQIWDILDDEEDRTKRNGMYSVFNGVGGTAAGGKGPRSQSENAKITGLSHNGWLCGDSAYGVASQPFAHPFWLFTGHCKEIRVWKWNGFAFNTSCDCSACFLRFESQGYGNVRCIAVSTEHIFASSDSNIIHFWRFSESEHNVNDQGDLTRNLSSSSMHSIGATASSWDKRVSARGIVEYSGNLQCGHRGMVTALKVFGDVLISGSKDGFVTIWSCTEMVNLSILHYGNEPVLDLSISPNPYPLCHITIWNQHLAAFHKRRDRQKPICKAPRSKTSRFLCPDYDASPESNKLTESPLPVLQYMSLHSLYDDGFISDQQRDTIHSTIRGYCGDDDRAKAMLESEDAPDVLQSVFRAAIPSTPGSSAGPECEEMVGGMGRESPPQLSPILSPQADPSASSTNRGDHSDQKRPRWLSREIMNAASDCSGVPRIAHDLKLIVGGGSGEIHVWHIGSSKSVVSPTTTWERESILRGHGDRVTRLASFGQHLVSGYSNGAIKLWKSSGGDSPGFVCCGTAYTDSVKRVGSAAQSDGKKSICNSVRSVVLLPSPTLNLKSMGTTPHRSNTSGDIWRNTEDENVNQLSEDEMELSFNELNVKVQANHVNVGDGAQRRFKDRKNGNGMNGYLDHSAFWILSGTSNGSMLLHKLDEEDEDDSDIEQYL